MKLLLSVVFVAAIVFAKDWPVQDKDHCTAGTKFVDKKGSPFLRECIPYGRTDVFSKTVACLDDAGNEVKFGGTFDRIQDPRNGHGFRFGCSSDGGRTEVKPVSCIFGKGSPEETVTTGYAALKSFNMGCTCQKGATSFSCDILKKRV